MLVKDDRREEEELAMPATELITWLKEHKLDAYASGFEAEGCEYVEDLVAQDLEEIADLSNQLKMKPFHAKRLAKLLKDLKEEEEEKQAIEEEKRAIEKVEKEVEKVEKEKNLKARLRNIRREEEREERELKEADEEISLRSTERLKALRREEERKDREWQEEEAAAREKTNTARGGATTNAKTDGMQPKEKRLALPENKTYFAFLSHKKMHSKNLTATENLALRVRTTQPSCQ